MGHILLNGTGKGYASETKIHPKPHLIVEQSYARVMPEINPVPMVDGHEPTLISEHFSNAQSSGYTNIQGGF